MGKRGGKFRRNFRDVTLMKYVLDTSILVLIVKNSKIKEYFEKHFLQDTNTVLLLSSVSLGELNAIIQKNNWGNQKIKHLNQLLQNLEIASIENQETFLNYGIIDAYSQNKLNGKSLPKNLTARNMGKNDLWIAATTMSNQATLITADKDFEHLNEAFFKVERLDIQMFKEKQ